MLKTKKKQNMCGASLFPFLAGFFVTIVDFSTLQSKGDFS